MLWKQSILIQMTLFKYKLISNINPSDFVQSSVSMVSFSYFLLFTGFWPCCGSESPYSLRRSGPALQLGQQAMSRRKMARGCCSHRPFTRPWKVEPQFWQRTIFLGLSQTHGDFWRSWPLLLRPLCSCFTCCSSVPCTMLLLLFKLSPTSLTLGVSRDWSLLISRYDKNFWKQKLTMK